MANKMYILVRNEIIEKDLGHAILSVAHAASAAGRNWGDQPEFEHWANESFRKVLCQVTDQEFDKAKTYFENGKDYQVMTECALDDEEISIVFYPREEWPRFFSFLKLWR